MTSTISCIKDGKCYQAIGESDRIDRLYYRIVNEANDQGVTLLKNKPCDSIGYTEIDHF